MKKVLVIMSFLCCLLPLRAQFASINIDLTTAAAMEASLASEWQTEEMSRQVLDKILEHYTNAEVATAGIFASKWLDRKAMTNVGLFDNAAENYYYKRIYEMVSNRIMPKIWTVASLMVKRPDLALYWGPYLYKITEETKALCMQFECVVTNSRLTFRDIAFLVIGDNLKFLFDLSQLAAVDWPGLFDNLVNFGSGITKEDLAGDLDDLLSAGASIANAGGNILDSLWVNASRVGGIFHMKPREIINMGKDFKNIYESMNSPEEIKQLLLSEIGSTDSTGVMNLFKIDNYNITNYVSNYINDMMGRYYKQRWYIYWHESGNELLASWDPPRDHVGHTHDHFFMNGEGGWFWVETNDKNYNQHPDPSVIANAKAAVAAACGWSQERCDQLNAEQDWYTYYIEQTLTSYYIYSGSEDNVVGWLFSYYTKVYRKWNHYQEVYEEWFDSQTMAESVMAAHMNAKAREFVDADMMETYVGTDGNVHSSDKVRHRYLVDKDSRLYYSAADAKKLENAVTCSFTLNCNGGAKLGEGNFQWKVNPSHSPLNERSKEYAMATSLEPGGLDTSECDDKISVLNQKITNLNAQIQSLEETNRQLLIEIGQADVNQAQELRNQYNTNNAQINTLKSQLTAAKNELSQMQEARAALVADYAGETDDCYRIPAVMHEIEANYQIQWEDAGTWVGYTFVRRGKVPQVKSICEFSATLSKIRGESHFLGVRYHRSIIGVTWQLTTNYSQSDVIEVMQLDPNQSDEERVDAVNQRQAELQAEFPDCTVEISYEYSNPQTVEDTDDTFHLLWVSDRVAIAREVDYRLTKIYSSLVLAEKFLRTRETILDYLKAQLVGVVYDGLHGHHSTEAFRRWRENSHKALENHLDSIPH